MFNDPIYYRNKTSTIKLGGINIRDVSRRGMISLI